MPKTWFLLHAAQGDVWIWREGSKENATFGEMWGEVQQARGTIPICRFLSNILLQVLIKSYLVGKRSEK